MDYIKGVALEKGAKEASVQRRAERVSPDIEAQGDTKAQTVIGKNLPPELQGSSYVPSYRQRPYLQQGLK